MGTAWAERRHSARVSPLRRALRRGEALLWLSRPVNLLMMATTSLFALLLIWQKSNDFIPPWMSWIRMVGSMLMIAAGGYWLNDIYDQPIDRINRPKRALWVARAGQRTLFSATLIIWVGAMALAIFLPIRIFFLHLIAILALAWYARFGKRTGLLGNAVIAALTGAVPWEVLLLTGRTVYAVDWMIPLAVGFNFVRELVKDAEDLPGDQAYGVRSLPGRIRPHIWRSLLKVLWMVLIGLPLLPPILHYFLWGRMLWYYLSIVLVTVILPLLWGLLEWGEYHSMSQMLKIAMIGGLLAVWHL